MDANLQRPYPLADRRAWAPGPGVVYDERRRALRLVGARAPAWTEAAGDARARLDLPRGAIDGFGTTAEVVRGEDGGAPRWSVVARGAGEGGRERLAPQPDEITDVALGHDDVLYVAIGDRVRLHDLRGRWADVELPVGAGRAWRLAAAAGGGVHVLVTDGATARLGRVRGLPARPLPFRHGPEVFRPRGEDPDPPRYEDVPDAAITGREAIAIASSPGGRVALLTWIDERAELSLLEGAAWGAPRVLTGVRRPYSLAWAGEDRVAALLVTEGGGTDAAVYPASSAGDGAPVDPVGEPYPLRAPTGGPFLHHVAGPPRYPSAPAGPGDAPIALPLLPLSWPSFVARGEARARRPLDGRDLGTIWHRLYLEAAIPHGCEVRVWLAATDAPGPPDDDAWFEHRFGGAPGDGDREVPRGVWLPTPSEVPFHPGALTCPPRPGIAGLFTALIQRAGRHVRTLAGRHLWVRVELAGDGRSTPELAALRVYGGRRGYAARYLPELYREDVHGPEADLVARASGPDFLDRFLGLFEGVLTPLEDRIRDAWLLSAPSAVPEPSLDWLASWLGFVFAPDLPVARRRRMLAVAHALYRRRGTLDGLRLALDVASDGGVGRGELVVIEDYRLRRTFATILGADLSDAEDPLTTGLTISGNSIVGDTLVLGEEHRRELLALFGAGLPAELAPDDAGAQARDEAAIATLFDRTAHRVTVLVHQEVRDQDLGLIRQILELETPAHVEVKLVTATYRFLVAVSSLIGVDTFLAPRLAPGAVRLDRSRVGVRDLVARLPSLDPRLGRGA